MVLSWTAKDGRFSIGDLKLAWLLSALRRKFSIFLSVHAQVRVSLLLVPAGHTKRVKISLLHAVPHRPWPEQPCLGSMYLPASFHWLPVWLLLNIIACSFRSCVSTTTCLPARSMTGRLRSSPCRYFPPAHRFPGFGQRQQVELGKHKEVKLTKLYQCDFLPPNLTSLSFFPSSLVFISFLCPVSSHPQHTRPSTIGSLFENL